MHELQTAQTGEGTIWYACTIDEERIDNRRCDRDGRGLARGGAYGRRLGDETAGLGDLRIGAFQLSGGTVGARWALFIALEVSKCQ